MHRVNQFLVLRFGWLYMVGWSYLLDVAIEALFSRPGGVPVGDALYCCCEAANNNGLAPIISPDSYYYIVMVWAVSLFSFHLLYLSRNRKRLGSLVHKARRFSRSASVWSAVSLVLIVRTLNPCYGVWFAGCLSFTFLGLVNMVAAEEDALDSTRWVLHQSFVSAVLVAILSPTTWSLHVLYALVPAVAALLIIFAHRYIPLPGPVPEDEFLLPVSMSDISSSKKKRSGYVPIPEHDTPVKAMTTSGTRSPSSELSVLSGNMKQPRAGSV